MGSLLFRTLGALRRKCLERSQFCAIRFSAPDASLVLCGIAVAALDLDAAKAVAFFLHRFVLVPRVTAASSHFFDAPLAKTFAAYTKPITPKHFRNVYSNDVMIGMRWNLMSPPPRAPPLDTKG